MTPDAVIGLFKKASLPKLEAAIAAEPHLVTARTDPSRWSGTSPLHHACCYPNLAALRVLLSVPKVEVNLALPCADADPATPLEWLCCAAEYDSQQLTDDRIAGVKLLLARGAKVSANALLTAIAPKSHGLVQVLLDHGAPFPTNGQQLAQLLGLAVERNHPVLSQRLLETTKVDVNTVLEDVYPRGSTALHLATKKRNEDIIAMLVKAGADAKLKNHDGKSVYDLLPKKLHPLLEGGAAPTPKPAAKPSVAASADVMASIWQSPDDRTLYAVLADQLVERGETARGEYVQLCLLTKRTPAQEKRRATLLKKHRGEWLGAVRTATNSWVDSEAEPGFVSHVKLTPEKFLANFDAVTRLGPRLTVELSKIASRQRMKELAALPLGARLHGLVLRNPDSGRRTGDAQIDDLGLELLAPALSGLKQLTCGNLDDRFTSRFFEHVAKGAGATLEFFQVQSDDGLDETFSEAFAPFEALVSTLTPKAFPAMKDLHVVDAGPRVQKLLKKVWGKKVRFSASTDACEDD